MRGDFKTVALVAAVLVLAASNLALVYILYSQARSRSTAPPAVCGCGAQAPQSGGAPPESSKATGPANTSSITVSLNNTPATPQANWSLHYTYLPLSYYLEIEAVRGPYPNYSAIPSIPEDLEVAIVQLSGDSLECPVTMKASMELGTATLNVTLPLPGDKCYRVTPVLTNRTRTEVHYRLVLQEDPRGACGRCARLTLRVSRLPPGQYIVTVGPELPRG